MKTLKLFLFSILLGFGFTQCSDPCDDVACVNGSCDEGICNCSPGYEGELCDTEIREKYFGIYTGDISSCFPDVGGQIDIDQLGAFTMVTLIASPGTNVESINLSSSSLFVNFNEDVSITSDFFNIPTTETVIDDPNLIPIAINLSANGIGEFIDENNISMDLVITVTADLIPIPFSQNCEIIFSK